MDILPIDVINYILKYCHAPALFLTCKSYEAMMTTADKYRLITTYCDTTYRILEPQNIADVILFGSSKTHDISRDQFYSTRYDPHMYDKIWCIMKYDDQVIYKLT